MKFTAVGDMAIQRRLPKDYEGFREVVRYIKQGDARFFNLETTVNTDCFGAEHSGGTWLRAEPEMLEDIKEFGFNLATFANNHSMDFSYNGLLQTLDNMKRYGFLNAGVGRNLSEASAPVYLDTKEGRAALISVTSTYSPGNMAGEQSRRLPGRPGVNALRIKRTVYVNEEDMAALQAIAKKTKINAYRDIIRKEGYLPPEEKGFDFDDIHFETGETGIKNEIYESDLKRVDKAIDEARLQADFILISVHSHELSGDSKENPSDFLTYFGHRCIDKGAHAVIGHGPHLLRPVELYKGCPIFYSLGDFALQLENGQYAPEDFYSKFGLTSDSSMYELFRVRTKNFTVGLQRQRVMMESVISCFEIEDEKLKKLEFMPVELGFGEPHSKIGLPRKAKNDDILVRLQRMSEPYGTKMIIENGIARVII